jgi:hypothetical protein
MHKLCRNRGQLFKSASGTLYIHIQCSRIFIHELEILIFLKTKVTSLDHFLDQLISKLKSESVAVVQISMSLLYK